MFNWFLTYVPVFKSLGLESYELQRWKHLDDVSFTIASYRPTCPRIGTDKLDTFTYLNLVRASTVAPLFSCTNSIPSHPANALKLLKEHHALGWLQVHNLAGLVQSTAIHWPRRRFTVGWKPALRETLDDEGELTFEQQNGIDVWLRRYEKRVRRARYKREKKRDVSNDLEISLIKGDRINNAKYAM